MSILDVCWPSTSAPHKLPLELSEDRIVYLERPVHLAELGSRDLSPELIRQEEKSPLEKLGL